jgi:uncharacterized protein YjiS (DUF1127 family)
MQTRNQGLDATGTEACTRGRLPLLIAAVARLFRRSAQGPANRVDHLDAHGLKDIGLDRQDAARIATAARADAFRLLMMRGNL